MSTPDKRVPRVIAGGVAAIVLVGAALAWRASARTNKVALSASPKPVTVIEAKGASYRAFRSYIGTLDPWVEAKVGPQFLSAYVDTVLVRPGAVSKRGDVLATLDCRTASGTSRAVAMQARAMAAEQRAVADEAARVQGMLDGGFVSPNEAERKTAESASQQAQLLSTQAKLENAALEVGDCVLRAPFDGEIAVRMADPGAFARPGTPIVSIVDRSVVRLTADAPEIDFAVVAPGTRTHVHILSTGRDVNAVITRRAPAADPGTRTVHFEIDIPDPKREIPVGTTGEIHIDVGEPVAATEVPLYAASVRGTAATLFVVEGGVARSRTVPVQGELGGSLFLEVALQAGSHVVTEGRALLEDGDHVLAQEAAPASTSAVPAKGVAP